MTSIPVEEQDELNEDENIYLMTRKFTKIIAQSDRIQFQWSHPSNRKYDDLEYILEFSCDLQYAGVEQFRKIYQGKAHKCIVADLSSSTTYKFRVSPCQKSDDERIDGEWSDVIEVKTLPKPE